MEASGVENNRSGTHHSAFPLARLGFLIDLECLLNVRTSTHEVSGRSATHVQMLGPLSLTLCYRRCYHYNVLVNKWAGLILMNKIFSRLMRIYIVHDWWW